MTIKTITTVDGINVVDFGNTINKYYWFKNLGGATIYVSNKEGFKAGDDGVSELTAKGDVTNIESLSGKVYILGAGKVEIHNTDSKLPPFKSAPVAGGGGGEVTVAEWNYTPPYDPGGLLANIMNTTGYNGGGYTINGGIQGRFGFYQSLSGCNITHSNLTVLTNVKKIKIYGGTVANTKGLSATAYYCISDETVTELDDRWTEIHSSTGTSVSNFSSEIDCSEITGEKFIYLAVKHGDENSGYTSYLYIDKIVLSGVGSGVVNADYATNAGNADTVDGYHVSSMINSSSHTPPEYITEFLRINDDTKSIERWRTSNLKVAFANNAAKAENAGTLDGKHVNDFIYPRAHLNNVDLNTILYPCSALAMTDCTNTPTTNSWGTLLCYSGGTGSHVQLWVSALDSVMYKRHYDGSRWSDWKEISTTPIRSVEVGGTTDANGNFTIWKASDGKIPIYAKVFGYYVSPFLSVVANDYYYYLGICDTTSHEWVANTAVTGTVYYIEI